MSLAAATSPTVLRDALVEHEHLVVEVVRGFRRRVPANVSDDELKAAGMIGLMDALRRHRPEQDASFDSYARTRVRGAIIDELRLHDWLPRRVRTASRQSDGSPTLHVVSLEDVPLAERAHALVSDQRNPEGQAAQNRTHARLLAAVDELPERQRLIVAMHYFDGLRFRQIGTILGVSEARISQLHSRSMEFLRGTLEDEPESGLRLRAAAPVSERSPSSPPPSSRRPSSVPPSRRSRAIGR